MRGWWRWAACSAVVAVFVSLPLVVRTLPVPGADESPTGQLLARLRASWSLPYAGYAETTGSLALPTTDQLDAVSNLLSGRTQIRVWWRSASDWRADSLTPSGETSTRTSTLGVSIWDFEDNRVIQTPAPAPGAVRLPQDSDMLPPQLAARMLGAATDAELSPLPSRRVAGRAADGLRMRPGDALSSVGQVDVWADRASGMPILVEVFGRTGATAAVSSTFLDFTDAAPTAQETQLDAPPGARVWTGQRFDLVRQIGRTSGVTLPNRLLGFDRSASAPGLEGVGQYGRGVTQIAVGALPGGLAASLRDQLALATGATTLPEGLVVSVGPVGLLLTTPQRDAAGQSWLVAGTLTPEGLARAATELAAAGSS